MTFTVEDTVDTDLIRLGQGLKIVGTDPHNKRRVIAFLSNEAVAKGICKLLNAYNPVIEIM